MKQETPPAASAAAASKYNDDDTPVYDPDSPRSYADATETPSTDGVAKSLLGLSTGVNISGSSPHTDRSLSYMKRTIEQNTPKKAPKKAKKAAEEVVEAAISAVETASAEARAKAERLEYERARARASDEDWGCDSDDGW